MPVRLAEVVRALPRHAHALPRRTVRESQRWRLLEAVVEATSKAGYADTTVADVIAVAKVSRKTFYEHFADKEAAFLAAYDELSDRMIDALVAAGADHADPEARRTAQVERFVALLDRDRAVARVFMVDVQGAGPVALRHRAAVNQRFAEALFGDAPVPAVRRDAVVGGVNQVVAAALLEPKPKPLSPLAGPLAAFVRAALVLLVACGGPQKKSEATLPAEVSTLLERYETCWHFRGEEGTSPERTQEIQAGVTRWCPNTEEDLARLRAKYKDRADVQAALDRTREWQ